MSLKKHIPNAITCCNLVCGCLAIEQSFEGNLIYAAYLVGLAAIFDFFDGFAARMLRVASPIGKDLDSLADMVTFGVVPGIMMFKLIQGAFNYQESIYSDRGWVSYHIQEISYIAFIIIVFSAVRLAKFNNDTRQTTSFIGLPTPANAILIGSFPLILAYSSYNTINDVIHNPIFLICASIILSFLLISEIPLFALKFRTFSWNGNRTRYIFLMLSVVLLILFHFVGIPLSILLYVIMSINSNYFAKRKERS
jgi:CDP-diacylglycerol--serine O-phosphatidyltransferase